MAATTTTTTRPATGQRALSFSPKLSVGRIFVRPSGSDDVDAWERLGEARWSVLIPEGMEVRLWIYPQLFRKALPVLRALPADSLAELVLLDSPVRDDDLRSLLGLTGLRLLDLFRTRVTDAGLEHVATFTTLEWLSFTGTRVGDVGAQRLASLTALRRLSLKDTDITDASAEMLKALPHLRWLSVSGTQIADEGLRTLGNSKSLRELSVHRTGVTQGEVKALQFRREDITLIAH